METLEPDVIIDLATLTGAQVVALGERTAAIYSGSDDLAASLTGHGAAAGEQMWRMPLIDDYRERFARMGPAQWKMLQDLFASAVDRFTVQIDGTHFLFVGEQGARAAAGAVTALLERSGALRERIAGMLDHV